MSSTKNELPQITLFSGKAGMITLWSNHAEFVCNDEDQKKLLKIADVHQMNISRGPEGLSVTIFHDRTKRDDIISQVKIWARTMGRVVVQKK